MNIEIIKTKAITVAPWNPRSAITDESVRSLATSIKADGQLQAINVIKSGNGYICFDGCRRLAACKLIGMASVKAVVWDIGEDEAKVKTVTSNLQREDDDPLLAARVIAELGEDAEIVASKLGKTAAWVRRRNKLNALCDEMREVVGAVTLESLERISDLTQDQQQKMAKNIAQKSKWFGGIIKWGDLKRDAEALTADLDAAWFDVADCAKCTERTGADWFADESAGKLGRCLNCACYKGKAKEWENAKISEAVGDAESVKVEHEWQMPCEARQDMGDKLTKKHPCAWYWWDGGELIVKWAKSKNQLQADRDAERAAAEAEREAIRAVREADDAVERKMSDYVTSDDGEAEIRMAVRRALREPNGALAQLIDDEITSFVQDAYGARDWARVIRAMPTLADLAGITDAERDAYLERHPEADGEEDGE